MTTGGVMVGLAGIQDNLFRPLRSDLIRIGPHKKDWGQRCLVRLSILPNFIRQTTADQPVDWSLGRLWLSSHAKETDRLFATAQYVETFVGKCFRKFQTTLC